MVKAESSLSCLQLIGGHVALDFANSIHCRSVENPCDLIPSYGAMVEWSAVAGILSSEQAVFLQQEGAARALEAERVLERALVLRQAVHEVFSSVAASRVPATAALAELNAELSGALCRRSVQHDGTRMLWGWQGSDAALDQMLWTLATAAADLLTSEDVQWIRECQASDCDRLFLDTSRNRRRQWCSMQWCGNREKARRSARNKRQFSDDV
ncbi:ABATE domain-containing protein [Candidatus Bipolaricaulota bacterium]|jgi:predicted RNA-binding Zn ribbon-like protein|nr:ABATE domain-containing protein [Candidatus Bipolaricaulota bacterium]TFH08650.1 MAG: hypothetical protein E4H08_07395 [Candidatus Atribacteria bacterium]